MTSNNKSGRKDWLTVHRGIAIIGILLFIIVVFRNRLPCDGDTIGISIFCDIMDAVLIMLGATMGALLGFKIQRYEDKKNKNDAQSEQ